MGIPVIKFKPNKHTKSSREILIKRNIDDQQKFEVEHEVNVDDDKKDLI
ncbi:hypothetical protein LCGC14_0951460 [marine sediment metagenome]|uniref:Uncharacterized protein n=1 Tax=marine sediment metagenome TaxID=412755 RepID=A0A0F9R0N1_9ZZZZ